MQNMHIGTDSEFLKNLHELNQKIKQRFNEILIDMTLFLSSLDSAQNKNNFKELVEFLSSCGEKFYDAFFKISLS